MDDEFDDTFHLLMGYLQDKIGCGPLWSDMDLIRIQFRYEFEPHGRATEDWDEIWRIELPQVQAMWYGTKGWKPCKPGLTQKEQGRTLHEALDKTLAFLRDAPWETL